MAKEKNDKLVKSLEKLEAHREVCIEAKNLKEAGISIGKDVPILRPVKYIVKDLLALLKDQPKK